MEKVKFIENGSVTSVPGFLAAGVTAGFKRSGAPDFALVYSEDDANFSGVFTSCTFAAAPVLLGREKVLKKIKEYHEKYGTTILLVSHSMEDIVKYSKTVLVMNKGKVFCHEDTDSVFSKQEEILGIGLDVPQVTKVVMKLRELGIDLGNDIYTTERAKERILNYLK